MKMRNMLRSMPFLLLMISGLSVFLNCNGPASNPATTFYTVTFDAQGGSTVDSVKGERGKPIAKPTDPTKDQFTFGGWYKESACTTPWNFTSDTVTADITLFAKWTPRTPATVTVTFTVKDGNGTLTAKADGQELTSPAPVKKDMEVTFTAEPKPGYEVDYLLINGENKSGTTVTVKADKDIAATVKFKVQGAPSTKFFTVVYKVEPVAGGTVSVKSPDGVVASGTKVEENTKLDFTAEPNGGYTISGWAGATAAPDNKTATLTVTGDSTVTVTFALKQYTVTFEVRGGLPMPNQQPVEHGKTIVKPEEPAKAPFTFGGWYKEAACTTPWNFTADTVTEDITLYAAWKTTVRFDSNKITCRKYGNPVNNNDTIYEDDMLFFTATPPSGQTVDKWTVNGVEYETRPVFSYTVRADDVKGNSITIGYMQKTAAQATIHFDSTKMTCWKNVNESTVTATPVSDGTSVDENTQLLFIAKPSEGKMADSWTRNGSSIPMGQQPVANSFLYTVEALSSITIDYTEKNAEQLMLQFDTSKIQCTKLFDQTPILPGSYYEGNFLIFTAKNGAAVKWMVNNAPYPSFGKYCAVSFMKERLNNETVINVTYE